MKGSFKIGQIAGIGIFIHWTFFLLLGWFFYIGLGEDRDFNAAFGNVGFVLSIFGCVVLHELGHALTARRYKIKTRDITLLPIGGVARLEKMPEDPFQELTVAMAGPAVNVVIAAVIFGLLWLGESVKNIQLDLLLEASGGFLAKLMLVNVILVLFNLLPAFPMDGGRAFRAILANWIGYLKATEVAASVGQMMAILFGILGIFTGNIILLVIALFIYLAAQAESQMAHIRFAIRMVPVREAMITDYHTLNRNDSLQDAARLLIAGSQQDFPVTDDGRIVGILPRQDLMKVLAHQEMSTPVSKVMRDDCLTVDDDDLLEQTFERMQSMGCPMLPVVRDDELVGIVTLENIGEWIMIQSALKQAEQS